MSAQQFILNTFSFHRRSKRHSAQEPATYTTQDLLRCSTPEARELVSYELAEKLKILPLGLIKSSTGILLTAASTESTLVETKSALQFATGCDVKLIPICPQTLQSAIFEAYHADPESFCARAARAASESTSPLNPYSTSWNARPHFRTPAHGAAKLLEVLIDHAVARRASDLHLIPQPDSFIARLRIDGALTTLEDPTWRPHVLLQMVKRIKVLALLDPTGTQSVCDGSFRVPINEKQVNVRVAIMPTVHGEKVSLRFIERGEVRTLTSLGLDARTMEALSATCERGEGAILFAGPTGSGKSTSMYALLIELLKQGHNVVTIEDPVEIIIPGASQTALDCENGIDYARGLRAILRQDPDTIMIGEMRDGDSASTALEAAITGHIVLSTIHAKSCLDMLLRLSNLGVAWPSIGRGVSLLIFQRLLPRLCESCKVVDLKETNARKREVFQPVGCRTCDYSGYCGRALAFESLSVNGELAHEISKLQSFDDSIRQHFSTAVFSPFEHSLARLLSEGLITIRDARAAAGV